MQEDCSTDELIGVINGNRKYVRCLYVYNKIDMIPLEDVETLARQPDSIVISVRQKLNLDYLLARMWDAMGLVRVCKKRGCPPDLDEPVVLSAQRHGITIEAATQRISKELLVIFNYAEVEGTSAKHSPQRGVYNTNTTRTSSRSSPRRTNNKNRTRATASASRARARSRGNGGRGPRRKKRGARGGGKKKKADR